MPAQQQDLRKNYIGIVSDGIEQQRAAESAAKSGHLVRDCFLALMAAVRKRRGGTTEIPPGRSGSRPECGG